MTDKKGAQGRWQIMLKSAASLSPALPVCLLLFSAFLAIYVRTAAPSVLSGDSAEFQLAAALLGVPHPTTYPLYTLLGKLATLIIPFGDMAYRVTLVSACAAALAVALLMLITRSVTGSTMPASLAALALGVAPGLWNAATMTEVYALLAALLAVLGCLLAADSGQHPAYEPRGRSPWLRWAAFIAGLGFSHHGMFAIVGLPLLLGYIGLQVVGAYSTLAYQAHGLPFCELTILGVCFMLGLAPWLYPLVQYARYGPFHGLDYGLPRHYFWGAPDSWSQAAGLLLGGPIGGGIFRIPSSSQALATLQMIADRLWFEFGPLGCALGTLGAGALLRQHLASWLATAWVFVATCLYLLLLGPAVEDAPVFTLPLLLPWALWIGVGGAALMCPVDSRQAMRRYGWMLLVVLLAATLAWGATRIPYTNKRQLWLFREFGQATLQQLSAHAVVIAHWEQGMTLQYLVLAEGQRPDVWVDVNEPSDVGWGVRAQRYPNRPVFLLGAQADVAGLPVDLVQEHSYASLYRLHQDDP